MDMRRRVQRAEAQRSRRVVALDATSVAAFRAWRRRQLEDKLALGPAYDDQGFVFTRADGRPFDPNDFSREFDRRVKRLDCRASGSMTCGTRGRPWRYKPASTRRS